MLESITKFFSLSLLELSVYDLVILVLFSLSLILTLVFALIVVATKVRKLNNDIDNQINEQISNEKAIINYLDVIMNYLSKEKIDIKSNVEIREDIKKQDSSLKASELTEKSSVIKEVTKTATIKSEQSDVENNNSIESAKPEVASKALTTTESKKNSLVLLEDEIKNIPLERQKIIENVAENINTLSALEQVSQQIESKIKATEQKESSPVEQKESSPVEQKVQTQITETTTKVSTTEDASTYNTSKDVGNVINVESLTSTEKLPEVKVAFNNAPNSLSQDYNSNVEINTPVPNFSAAENNASNLQEQQANVEHQEASVQERYTPRPYATTQRTRPTVTNPALNRTEQLNRTSPSVRQSAIPTERLRPTRFLTENAVDKAPNFNNNLNSRINRDNVNDSAGGVAPNKFHFKPVSLNLLNRTEDARSNSGNNLIGSNAASYNNEEGQTNMYNNTMNRSMGGMTSMGNRSGMGNNRSSMGARPMNSSSSFGGSQMGGMNNKSSMGARPMNNNSSFGGSQMGGMNNKSAMGARPMNNNSSFGGSQMGGMNNKSAMGARPMNNNSSFGGSQMGGMNNKSAMGARPMNNNSSFGGSQMGGMNNKSAMGARPMNNNSSFGGSQMGGMNNRSTMGARPMNNNSSFGGSQMGGMNNRSAMGARPMNNNSSFGGSQMGGMKPANATVGSRPQLSSGGTRRR